MAFHTIVFKGLTDVFKTIRFQYHRLRKMMRYGDCKYPYIEHFSGCSIRLLATGPSLNDEVEELRANGELTKYPIFVMNFFALSNMFIELQPSRYCLADQAFFFDSVKIEKVKNIYSIFNNEVTWGMSLYVPDYCYEVAKKRVTNESIIVIPISTLHYEGFESKRNIYYKMGIATPSFVNVLIMVEYICLNEGFARLFLHGVDHTFLTNLVVDEDNVLKVVDTHFYGEELVVAAYHDDGTPWSVAEFIYDKYLTFVEHERMRKYADYLGAEIINCTKCSWIDSYIRLAQIENNN